MEILFFVYLSSGLFLGWSLGANDAANIFGTAVGTRMIKFRTAAWIASVFVVLGAVCAGGGTTATIDALGSVNAVAGAFMVALSAALAVYWMVSSGILVSTSQAIVGAIIGWNIYSHKPTNTDVLSVIVGSWVFCPLLSAGIAMVLYWLVKLWLRHSKMHLLRRDSYIRGGLIFLTAFGAYALGANNIANVMGVFVESSPFTAVSSEWLSLSPEQILFLIGALSIGAGIFTYSNKTIKTVGKNLMSMTPVIALIAVFAHYVAVIAAGFVHVISFKIHLVSKDGSVESAESPERVSREQCSGCFVKSHHYLRPVNHRREDESEHVISGV